MLWELLPELISDLEEVLVFFDPLEQTGLKPLVPNLVELVGFRLPLEQVFTDWILVLQQKSIPLLACPFLFGPLLRLSRLLLGSHSRRLLLESLRYLHNRPLKLRRKKLRHERYR